MAEIGTIHRVRGFIHECKIDLDEICNHEIASQSRRQANPMNISAIYTETYFTKLVDVECLRSNQFLRQTSKHRAHNRHN